MDKLKTRDPRRYRELLVVSEPEPHPLFQIVAGEIEAWECIKKGECG
jgi:hypothetical protein